MEIMSQAGLPDWDAYWRDHEIPDYVNVTPQLLETIVAHVDLSSCRALEIGVGTGGNSSDLASLGAQVFALDLSSPALLRAQATAVKADVALLMLRGDACSLPFESQTFDLVFHQGFLEHFTDPVSLLREQRRVLRPHGYILVDVPQRYNWYTVRKRQLMRAGRWPYGGWEREFSLGELSALLEADGFRIVSAYGRGYYPRPLEMIRNASKIETKLLKRRVLPKRLWELYDAWWNRFEKTSLGCHTLQCVGVLAQAREA